MQDDSPADVGASGELPPHADPLRWDELIAGLKPEAMLVVIASSMSKTLREQCSPEDLWQETLALAWRDRAQHRWESPTAFRAWLFEIARNRIRETARRLSSGKRGAGAPARRMSDLGASASSALHGLHPADSATPSRILARGEKKAAVLEALSRLPPELGDIVRLHLLEELTMEAIAERLGIGISAAWHRFRKGSEILARSVPDLAGDGSTGAW